ncbi:phage portal protein [Oceaniglobus trochenteri]|uniref:phage portal protein n=1 Tax=Oceaniglobus trochenteri TaxID=2763260 RepID=UPI001CFFCAAC|nr:phage portal protein [Oceaniglobus trochenteri]
MGLLSMFSGAVRADVDPSARARNPADDFWYGPAGRATAAGVTVTVERARTVPVVRDCLEVLSKTVASLALGVFERQDDDSRVRRGDHPIARLLRNPNPRETSFEFLANMVDDLAAEGVFLAERVNQGEANERLWRIAPQHFDVEELPDRGLRFRVREPNKPERVLLDEEVWYIPLPPVCDTRRGRSPILKDGVEAIGAALALQRYANSFFSNDATPPILFRHKGNFADKESKENFLRAWQRALTGRNRHKPGVLEYDMTVEQLAHSNEQAQFLETRKELWLDISRLWRIPPHKVGILDKATFSNIEEQSLDFVIGTLGPWLEMIEGSVNKHLLNGEERFYFEFNVDSLLRGDIESRFQAYALGRNWGWLSVNEIRRRENLNGIGPEGDRFMEPLNMAPVGNVGRERKEASDAIAFLRQSVARNGGRPNLKVIKNAA